MIPSTQGQSLKEVLAEMNRLVPSVEEDENPTTNRKGTQSKHILLPSGLKVSELREDLGLCLSERYLLILSHIYLRGLLWKKEEKGLGNCICISRDEARRLGGEKYASLLAYGLIKGHLVKGRSYKIGRRFNEYMLNQQTLSLRHQLVHSLESKRARQIHSLQTNVSLRRFSKRGPVYRRIAEGISGLTFDYSGALKYVASLPPSEKRDHRRNEIERLLFNGYFCFIDDQGRNYTVIVQLPRDIRRFLSYGGEPLYVVDIKSSHPLLHVLLYPTECPEKTRYRSIVEDGMFWEHLNAAAGNIFDLSDENGRDALKKRANAEVFYAFPEPKFGTKSILAQSFKREFPLLWGEMDARKVRDQDKAAGPISKAMQKTEAELVQEAVMHLLNKNFPSITIHDAIATTKDGVQEVEQALADAFRSIGLSPKLATKKLTS